jgi:MinD-like ATPase involved in chromosome partitioning or flagellar assembly
MAEHQLNSAITAIRSSETEGFVASTLFSQGWSINFRALDIESLIAYMKENGASQSILLISTDCEGLTPEIFAQLKKLVPKVILFHTSPHDLKKYSEALAIPATALELIALIRGTLRMPLIRTSVQSPGKPRAKVFAIAAVSGGLGCTTFAVNLAHEIAVLEKKCIVIDAHPYAPAIAALLGQRGLRHSKEPRQISQNIFALEITQGQISEGIQSLEEFIHDFDFVVIDLGTIQDFASNISGRRWSSEVLVWVSNVADEIYFLTTNDFVGIERLKTLTQDLTHNSIKPSISFLQVQRPLEKRTNNNNESFLKLVTPLKPRRVLRYPYDARSVYAAHNEQSTLLESNEKSLLRKAIAHIAGEVIS